MSSSRCRDLGFQFGGILKRNPDCWRCSTSHTESSLATPNRRRDCSWFIIQLSNRSCERFPQFGQRASVERVWFKRSVNHLKQILRKVGPNLGQQVCIARRQPLGCLCWITAPDRILARETLVNYNRKRPKVALLASLFAHRLLG
jgi:hypothetical protein